MKDDVYGRAGGLFFNECISIMHGKLVLSPVHFHGAISDLVVQTFLKRFLFCETRRDSYAESSRTAPIFSFTL